MLDEQVKRLDQKFATACDMLFNFIWSYVFHVIKYIAIFFEGILVIILIAIYAIIPIKNINPAKLQFKHFSHKET